MDERSNVFISGADRGVGFALCEQFAAHGYHVFAGQFMPQWKELEQLGKKYPEQITCIGLDVSDTESVRRAKEQTAACCEKLDILVNCAGIAKDDSREGLKATLNVNVFGAMRMTESFLPLMEGGRKRLCFVSSEAGCVTLLHRKDGYAYCGSKTVMNMMIRLMFNELHGKGFTFRVYHPGWVRSYMMGEKAKEGNFEPEESAEAAYGQFVSDRSYEDVLLMTDVKGEAWPF